MCAFNPSLSKEEAGVVHRGQRVGLQWGDLHRFAPLPGTRGIGVTRMIFTADLPGGPPTNVRAMGSTPGPEGFHTAGPEGFHMLPGATKLSCATTTEAHAPQSLSSETRERHRDNKPEHHS